MVGLPARVCPRAARGPGFPTAPRRCGAGAGWISETTVSAAKRGCGKLGRRRSRRTSSAWSSTEMRRGVELERRRPTSSVTFAIVAVGGLARQRGHPLRRRVEASVTTSFITRRGRRRKRATPSIPEAVHSMSFLVGRPHEQDVQADGVCAVHRGRAPPGPRRSRASSTSSNRPAAPGPGGTPGRTAPGTPQPPHVVHRLDEEAPVEQVTGRVVDAADVQVDR